MNQWDGIDEFVAIAKHGSFSAAAEALGLSRTHMSRSVADLEDRLKVRLLNRTTRTVKLTTSGETFFYHCGRMIADRNEAIALVGGSGEPHGELLVTCSTALGERYVAPLVQRFAQDHPNLRVNLDLSNRIVDLVSEGYDLAIRTGHLASSSLVASRIAERRLFTCAAPSYLARVGLPTHLKELDDHDCLVGTSALWHFASDGVEQLYRPNGRWRCNNGEVILSAALDGMGVCQLPDFYVRDVIADGQLIPVLENLSPPPDPVWAVYPSRRHLMPKVSKLVELLRRDLPQLLAECGLRSRLVRHGTANISP